MPLPPAPHSPCCRRRFPHTLLLLVLALGVLSGCGQGKEQIPAVVDPLDQSAGHWLLINYWAEWCKPCLEEIPELNRFAEKYPLRARVLLVNFDGVQGAALQEAAARLGIKTTVLEQDPASRFDFQPPQALPATYVIAPGGELARVLLGPQTVTSLETATQLEPIPGS